MPLPYAGMIQFGTLPADADPQLAVERQPRVFIASHLAARLLAVDPVFLVGHYRKPHRCALKDDERGV